MNPQIAPAIPPVVRQAGVAAAAEKLKISRGRDAGIDLSESFTASSPATIRENSSGKYLDAVNSLRPIGGGPLALDLFAGCGGLSLGFEAAGFETLGYEMVDAYSATYNKNLRGRCYAEKLTANTRFPETDVVIGGPPCQPFSVGGHQQGLDDSRNGFPAFIAAIEQVRPAVFLFENVRGLMYRNRWYLDDIASQFREMGYAVDWHLLNAVNYGVPQNRERIIFVGHKKPFTWPAKSRGTRTAAEAIGETANTVPAGARFLTASMDRYVANYERASKCINPRDLHLDKPARTLTCRNIAAPTGDMHRVKLADGRRRRLVVREAARLQSFPDWFEFCGSETEQFYQIGNAVPPLFAFQLAQSVRACVESPLSPAADGINNTLGPSGQSTLFAKIQHA